MDRSLRSDRTNGLVGRYVATDSLRIGRYVATDREAWSDRSLRSDRLVADRSLRSDRPRGLVGRYIANDSLRIGRYVATDREAWFRDDLEESGDFGVFWSLLSAELHRRVRCMAMDGDLPTRHIAEVIPILLKSGQSASREEAVEEMKDCRSTVHPCR
ncbi:hypothetical protein F2Q70_00004515 [Brassica cretica]|uniref:Uncharacterized protein n=1 Tax=Brassica cretica TaxID=69181 RepID=A0A8S9FRY4_BRACR|nr:hypothetical protein F2Q68_00021376 [Brassica cretica]KAF2574142.1 hypothetical protein F2Q70_00004515 [Brassica cretica]